MDFIYKYEGTISQLSSCGHDIILGDIHDWRKPPVRLTVPSKALAKYLDERSCTDFEERYLTAEWWYDRNLFLKYVVIPSRDSKRPAKVITTTDGYMGDLVIFGQEEYIDLLSPDPMGWEEVVRWNDLRYEIS